MAEATDKKDKAASKVEEKEATVVKDQETVTGEVELTPQNAVVMLIRGVNIAQSKGAFTLEQASSLDAAIKLLTKKP